MTRRPDRILLPCSLVLAAFLGGCGAEGPRLNDAGPRPAEIPRRAPESVTEGAVLAATGRQAFEGWTLFRCNPHDGEGLQLSFRTGDPEIPAVALRIDEMQGDGPHRGRLFVTGRSRSGALVTSTGEAEVEVQRQDLPDGSAATLLSGSFQGSYGGQAGKGSVQGRFGRCDAPLPQSGETASAAPAAAP